MVLFLPTHNPMTMRGYLMYYTKKANHTHTPKCESHTQSHVKSTWNLLRIGIAFSVQDVISPGFKERVFVKSDSLDLHSCFEDLVRAVRVIIGGVAWTVPVSGRSPWRNAQPLGDTTLLSPKVCSQPLLLGLTLHMSVSLNTHGVVLGIEDSADWSARWARH
jgi:hypothetical protein